MTIDIEKIQLEEEEIEKLMNQFCVTPSDPELNLKVINPSLFSKLVNLVYKKGALAGIDLVIEDIQKNFK
jgi:hypothetical protein